MPSNCTKNPHGPACKKDIRDGQCGKPGDKRVCDKKKGTLCKDTEHCKRLERDLLKALGAKGVTLEVEINKSINEAVETTEKALDMIRSANAIVATGAALANSAIGIYNAAAEDLADTKPCKIISPADLKAKLEEEGDDPWLKLMRNIGYIPEEERAPDQGAWDGFPTQRAKEICVNSCDSEIYNALEAAHGSPGVDTILKLWTALTRTRHWTEIIHPYQERFFHIVPYQYYIMKIVQMAIGKLMENIAELPEEVQEEIWEDTPCGKELIEKNYLKASTVNPLEAFSLDPPHIPPIPYIKIPGLMQLLKNILIDALAFSVCCALEPLLVFIAEAMDESFKEWIEGVGEDEELGLAEPSKSNIMPPLTKADINQFLSNDVLEEAIARKLVGFIEDKDGNLISTDISINEIRDYISYVSGPELLSVTQRKVVFLLMGETDCTTMNILIMVGADHLVAAAYLKDFNEAIAEKYKESASKQLELTLNLKNFDKTGLNTKEKILSFFEFLGQNMDMFGLLDESKAVECVPDFCEIKEEEVIEAAKDLNATLCDLLNPDIGFGDLRQDMILNLLNVDESLKQSLKAQLDSLFEMSLDTLDITRRPASKGGDSSGFFKIYADGSKWLSKGHPLWPSTAKCEVKGSYSKNEQTFDCNSAAKKFWLPVREAAFAAAAPVLTRWQGPATDIAPGFYVFSGNYVYLPDGSKKRITQVFPGMPAAKIGAAFQFSGWTTNSGNKTAKDIVFLIRKKVYRFSLVDNTVSGQATIKKAFGVSPPTPEISAVTERPASVSGGDQPRHVWFFQGKAESEGYNFWPGGKSDELNAWGSTWKDGDFLQPVPEAAVTMPPGDTLVAAGLEAKWSDLKFPDDPEGVKIADQIWFFKGSDIYRWYIPAKNKAPKYLGLWDTKKWAAAFGVPGDKPFIEAGNKIDAAFYLDVKPAQVPMITEFRKKYDDKEIYRSLQKYLAQKKISDVAAEAEALETVKKYLLIDKAYLEASRRKFDDTRAVVSARRTEKMKREMQKEMAKS